MTGTPDPRSVTDEALNAYVDGALSQTEAADVARAAATVPDIAHRIAVLHHLKASVAGLADDVVLIDRPFPVATAPLRTAVIFGLATLAAAGFGALSAFWATADRTGPDALATGETIPPTSPPALSGFVAVHDAWIAAGGPDADARHSTDWLQDLMQETGLAMVHHAMVPGSAGKPGHHFAFVGANGCRLSLFEVAASDRRPVALEVSIRDGLLAAGWTEGGRAYALVARNMNEGRFVTIAAALHDASRHRGPVGDRVLAGLQQARQPCLG